VNGLLVQPLELTDATVYGTGATGVPGPAQELAVVESKFVAVPNTVKRSSGASGIGAVKGLYSVPDNVTVI
jgi:hypothetical protein